MSKQLLTAYELVGGYGKIDILHGVSLSVGVGEIVSVIGPNGAGKSTAFKTIVGFLRPRSGRVVFNGEEITGIRPDVVIQRGLAYVPQGRPVFPQMTVLENLEMGAYTVGEPARVAKALERAYELFPILSEPPPQRVARAKPALEPRALTLLALVALVPAGRGPLHAESPKQVKVTLDFRRASTQSRDAVQGGGRVIVTERGAAR